MKHHHSRRGVPAGQRARYALRPREIKPGLHVAGRKGILLLWIDQSKSAQRRDLRRFCERRGILLERVQRFGGKRGLLCFEATGEPAALAQLAGFPMVQEASEVLDATVQQPRLEDFACPRSVRLAQPAIEGREHKQPLPPLPSHPWLNGAGK